MTRFCNEDTVFSERHIRSRKFHTDKIHAYLSILKASFLNESENN